MSEVTEKQIGAVKLLTHPRVYYSMTMEEQDALKVVLGMLPESVKNPQPALPTEPGPYEQEDGFVVILGKAGAWWRSGKIVVPTLPLHRLVPERPQVTRQELIDLLSSTINLSNGYRADQILALLARNSA